MSMNVKANPQIFARVWKAELKNEKRGQLQFSTSRKDKTTGNYVNSYWNFWGVAGSALEYFDKLVDAVEEAGKKGVSIVIKSFSMSSEKYTDKNTGEEVFSKMPQFTIWDWDFSEPADKDMDTPAKSESTPKKNTKKVVEQTTPFDEPGDVSLDWPEE